MRRMPSAEGAVEEGNTMRALAGVGAVVVEEEEGMGREQNVREVRVRNEVGIAAEEQEQEHDTSSKAEVEVEQGKYKGKQRERKMSVVQGTTIDVAVAVVAERSNHGKKVVAVHMIDDEVHKEKAKAKEESELSTS